MKPIKYTFDETKKIDLGTKIIYKYPTPTKDLDVGLMILKGRHPKDEKTFIVETGCNFVMYITKGTGVVFAGEEKFEVKVGDVVFVPTNNKFAVVGEMEYVTVDNPAFYMEQSKEVVE